MTRAALLAAALALGACAAKGPPDLRYFTCADGTGFNAELVPGAMRLHTPTGVVVLPRARGDEGTLYTNGLRSVILLPDGTARHAVGRRAWVTCRAEA